jgi:hypothetical protein
MRFKLATVLLLSAAGVANASPRETLTFSNVASDGEEGGASNVVLTSLVTGGYGVTKVRVSATLNAVNPGTYGTEAMLKITPPGGTPFYIQLSAVDAPYTTLTYTNVDVYLPSPVAEAAGTWEVRFFELYDDGGVDANWSNLSITLDDQAPGYFEVTDAGNSLETAAIPTGTGPMTTITGTMNGDDDLYKIEVCDPASFVATTVYGSAVDTRLFLFSATGHGVVFNDDYAPTTAEYFYQSRIHNLGNLTAGTYYLGVSAFQRMAVNAAGQVLWNNQPYDTIRAPDGPGAAGALANWTGLAQETGDYVVILTGACYSGGTQPTCGTSDFNGDGDFGTDQDIEAFFACLGGVCCPTCWQGGSDFNGDGDFGTDQDIEAFFRVLSGAPC